MTLHAMISAHPNAVLVRLPDADKAKVFVNSRRRRGNCVLLSSGGRGPASYRYALSWAPCDIGQTVQEWL